MKTEFKDLEATGTMWRHRTNAFQISDKHKIKLFVKEFLNIWECAIKTEFNKFYETDTMQPHN